MHCLNYSCIGSPTPGTLAGTTAERTAGVTTAAAADKAADIATGAASASRLLYEDSAENAQQLHVAKQPSDD